jgi:hypothetical protein
MPNFSSFKNENFHFKFHKKIFSTFLISLWWCENFHFKFEKQKVSNFFIQTFLGGINEKNPKVAKFIKNLHKYLFTLKKQLYITYHRLVPGGMVLVTW